MELGGRSFALHGSHIGLGRWDALAIAIVYLDCQIHGIHSIHSTALKMHLLTALSCLLAVSTTAATTNQTAPGTIPGTTSHYITAGGHRYHYLDSHPVNASLGTILLLHGFPDFAYAWRFQVPFLTSLGYRVIAPDLLGYAGTDAPCELSNWAGKKMSTDLVEMLDQIAPGEQIILGGHDWGAGLAYMFAAWYPNYLSGFFTIAIPYMVPFFGPVREWVDLLDLVQDGTYPNLAYMLQWRDPAVDRNHTTKAQVRASLNAAFGGLTPDGRPGISPHIGFLYDVLPSLGNQSLVSAEDFELYVDTIHRNGLGAGFNWYRTRRMNWEDELAIVRDGPFVFKTPHLFIPALGDFFVPKEEYEKMKKYFENSVQKPVEAGHWAMWEKPDEVNEILREWMGGLETWDSRK